MSNARTFGPDRWVGSARCKGCVVQLKNNAIINIPDGRYHLFFGPIPNALKGLGLIKDDVTPSQGGRILSFFGTLLANISSQTGYAFEFKMQDNTSDLDRSCTRLMMRASSGVTVVTNFGIRFNNATKNFSPGWLGYPADALATGPLDADGWMRAPYGVTGIWCSTSEHGGRARHKDPDVALDIRSSSGQLAYAARAEVGRFSLRSFEYGYIPGATIHPDYAQDPLRAKWGGVPQGSTGQHLLAIYEQLAAGHEVLVVHDRGQDAGFGLPDGMTELVKIHSGDWSSLTKVARPMQIDARDQYLVGMPPLWVKAGRYGY